MIASFGREYPKCQVIALTGNEVWEEHARNQGIMDVWEMPQAPLATIDFVARKFRMLGVGPSESVRLNATEERHERIARGVAA